MSSSTPKVLDAQASKIAGSTSSSSGLEDAGSDSVALPMSGMQTVQPSPASGACVNFHDFIIQVQPDPFPDTTYSQIRSRITVVCAEVCPTFLRACALLIFR